MQLLHVDFQAVQNRDREELKKYAFCIAAGAAMASNVTFDFTIDEFILACPHDWKARVEQLIENQASSIKYRDNDQSIESKEAEAAQSDETPEAVKQNEKIKNKIN